MEASSTGRRGVPPLRLAAGAAFMLLIVTGCGAGVPGNDRPAPERVTVTVTAGAPEITRTTESAESGEPAGTGDPAPDRTAVRPGGVLTDGGTVASELTRAGQRDGFALDLGDAREFYVTDMTGDDIRLQVYSEVDGRPVGPSDVALSWGTSVVKLTKAGGHRLEVFGNTNVVGPYGFRIATVKVRTFPAAIGLRIGEGGPDGAGRLDVPGRVDRFEFDADGASAIKILGGAGACEAIELELVDAAQRSVASPRQPIPLCGYESDIPLSNGDGRYALVVRSGTAKTGPYSFQIVRAG
ncbi:hypothetical protein [Streptosporangium sandarakinum]|uniref:Uncharacterized protein n=1 Tax=Streptosporangium sandarakinum TaxID=1260955 RepID=A0A852UY17_9ACTN|nr:hypothetical protein [Streptosporangium sandarakinum]NYF40840.1 hypothetical protein [Streptosporangium sandarakinum]